MAYSLGRAILSRHVCKLATQATETNAVSTLGSQCMKKIKFPLAITKPTTFFAYNYSIKHDTPNPLAEDSAGESDKENQDIDVKSVILDQALDFVDAYGWSREAISNGAEAAGYAGVAEGMFGNGGSDLALYFVRKCNEHFEEYLQSEGEKIVDKTDKATVTAFLRDAIEFRLRMIIPYINKWPQAMSVLLHPSILISSMDELARMVDDVWYYAGDTSFDMNWYAKRGVLTKLYASTQLVMLTDQSPDFHDTWQFLERRLNDMERMSEVSDSIQQGGETLSETIFAGFTVLRNITGFGEQRR